MRKLGTVLTLAVLIAVIPTMADQGDKIIRFGAAYSSPTDDYHEIYSEDLIYDDLKFEPDAAIGPYFGFEWLLTDLIGIDATMLFTDHDIDYCWFVSDDGVVLVDEQGPLGSISSMPLLISSHFHVVRNSAIDFYLGPTIGYNFYGDLKFVSEIGESSMTIGDEFMYGVVFGIDKGFGSKGWTFSSALRYLLTEAESDELIRGGAAIGFDPWILHVGAGKRW